jgi:hypothetical protein
MKYECIYYTFLMYPGFENDSPYGQSGQKQPKDQQPTKQKKTLFSKE